MPSIESLSKLSPILQALAVLIIPVVVAFIANAFTKGQKERDIQTKMVEVAINILKDTPTPFNLRLRTWAVGVLDKYSDIPFSAQTRDDLIRNISLERQPIVEDFAKRMEIAPTDKAFEGRSFFTTLHLKKFGMTPRDLGSLLQDLGFLEGDLSDTITPKLVDAVQKLQRAAGLQPDDGIFGSDTKLAAERMQSESRQVVRTPNSSGL